MSSCGTRSCGTAISVITCFAALFVAFSMVESTLSSCFAMSLQYDDGGGRYVFIISNGNLSDFGWTSTINQARVATETSLGMAGTQVLTDIPDRTAAFAVVLDIVRTRGARVVISCSSQHGDAIPTAAVLFPNVTFAYIGLPVPTVPNLSALGWNDAELFYMAGVFCAAVAWNSRVGFVAPGPGYGSVQVINAFLSGVMSVDPNATVYAAYTRSYTADDRAAGAATMMINTPYNAGCIASNQDDDAVPVAAMAAGLLAVGTHGFSVRSVYGEQVGISFLRDWKPALARLFVGARSNSQSPVKYDYTAGIANGGQSIDTASYLVTSEQMATFQAGVGRATGGFPLWLCGAWLADFGLNSKTGCLINSSTFGSRISARIESLGFYEVPTTSVSFPQHAFQGIVSLTALLGALPVTAIIVLVVGRRNEALIQGGRLYLAYLLVGCAMVYGGVIAWVSSATIASCVARIWLPSLGATLVIGSLLIKNLAVWIAFHRASKMTKTKSIGPMTFSWLVVGLLLVNAVFLSAFTVVGIPLEKTVQGTDGLGAYETRVICAYPGPAIRTLYALFAFHLTQLAAGCVLSYKLGIVHQETFNERRPITMVLWMVTFCFTVVIAIIFAAEMHTDQLIVVVSIVLLLCSTCAIIVVVGSRFMQAFSAHGQTMLRRCKTMLRGSSSASLETCAQSNDIKLSVASSVSESSSFSSPSPASTSPSPSLSRCTASATNPGVTNTRCAASKPSWNRRSFVTTAFDWFYALHVTKKPPVLVHEI